MNVHETRRYLMFGRVEAFGKAKAADFEPFSEAANRFAALAQIMQELDAAKASQRRGRATAKAALIESLRTRLRNIARSARAIAKDKPGFAGKFRVPESKSQIRLLTAADTMLIALSKRGVAAKFVAHELPADFVERLRAHLRAIADARYHQKSGDQRGITSTAAVSRLVKAGMKEVAYLDAIIGHKYEDSPEHLRAWHSAHTLERAPRRERKGKSGATAGEAPAAPST